MIDKDVNVLGIIAAYDAIVWTTKLNEPGYFKASFLFTEEMNRILQLGNLLYKTDEKEPAIIRRRYLKLNKYGEETIEVQGYMASRILNQRIIWSKMIMQGTSEDIMRKMVQEQIISPSMAERRIDRIKLGEKCGYADAVEKQVTYDHLQETLTDVANAAGLGYRLRLDLVEKIFYFEVYKGTDRTSGTEEPCIFSRDMLNVYTENYSEDDSNMRNICLVGGTGEDENRTLVTVGSGSGIDRYEMFYNASGISEEKLTTDQYKAQLKQKGEEKLADCQIAKSFENRINQKRAESCELGDYVTCVDTKWGIMIDAQIKEIEKGFSKEEETLVITFGDQAPTLIKLIKTMR